MAWAYRKPLTINSTLTPGALTNFPLLFVRASDTDLAAKAQADGDDIAFFDSDETTQLDHEIESYNSGTGALIAWIRKPSLPATGNPIIYLHYGDAALGSQQNAAGVWGTSSHLAAWHMYQNPAGTPPQMLDASGNANHGTANGTFDAADVVAAQIGNGLDFGGAAWLEAPTGIAPATAITLSAWIFMRDWSMNAADQEIIFRSSTANTGNYVFEFNAALRDTDTHRDLYFGIGGNNLIYSGVASVIDLNEWHLIHAVSTNGGSRFIYVDGVQRATSAAVNLLTVSETLYLGGRSVADDNSNAILDEMRVASVARSVDWVLTEFNNQNAPTSFITVGAEEALASGAAAATQYYRRLMG